MQQRHYRKSRLVAIDVSIDRAVHAAELAAASNAARRIENSTRRPPAKPEPLTAAELADIRTFDRRRIDRRAELVELFRGSSVRPAHLFAS